MLLLCNLIIPSITFFRYNYKKNIQVTNMSNWLKGDESDEKSNQIYNHEYKDSKSDIPIYIEVILIKAHPNKVVSISDSLNLKIKFTLSRCNCKSNFFFKINIMNQST
jgi:hypothetical protein